MESITPTDKDMETAREVAHRFWSIHPKEIQDMKTTRQEFYAKEIATLIAEERERCAVKVSTFFDWCDPIGESVNMKVAQSFADEAAAAIRKQGEK